MDEFQISTKPKWAAQEIDNEYSTGEGRRNLEKTLASKIREKWQKFQVFDLFSLRKLTSAEFHEN